MSKGAQTTRQTQAGTNSGTQSQQFNNAASNSQMLDPNSQAYVDWQRNLAQQGVNAGAAGPDTSGMMGVLNQFGQPEMDMTSRINSLMDPYMANVVNATRGEYDHMRDAASMNANQLATQAGAFGGSRHGVMEGARLGEIDRAQGSQIAGLLSGGFGNAMNAAIGMRGQDQANNLNRAQFMFGAQDHLRNLNDPMMRAGQALGVANLGMGPTGWMQNSTNSGSQNGSSAGTYSGNQSTTVPGQTFMQTLGQLGGLGLGIGSMFMGGGGGSIFGATPSPGQGVIGSPPPFRPGVMQGPGPGGMWGP
jgi:hypothetical protein